MQDQACANAPVGDAAPEGGAGDGEQTVTPWEVSASRGIDYNKLIEQFGCQRLEDSMIQRVEKLTGKKPHPFLRRGIFFAHR